MKRLLILAAFGAALEAQSVSIAIPTANQPVSGYSGFSFAVSLTNAPSVVRVCYAVDGYPAANPGFGPLATIGCTITPSFSLPWNSFWVLNGSHNVSATAYDSLGNAVATSSPAPFTVANSWPISCVPGMSVSTSTPVSSSWSGHVTISLTMTGACASDNSTANFYIDGIPQQSSIGFTGPATSSTVDTTQFTDGVHNVCATTSDNTNGLSISGTAVNAATDWCSPVTFANGANAMEVRNNAHEIFLAPGGTFQLVNSAVNNNGSSGGSPNYDYLAQLSSTGVSVATVSSSGLVTASSSHTGAAQITTLWEACSGADLTISSGGIVRSSTCPFYYTDTGRLINIKSGSGFTPGLYLIAGYAGSNGVSLSPAPGTSLSGGTFATGPSRVAWVYVWPTNTLPHFGGDGSILTSYNPAKSFFPHCMFSSSGIFSDQAYSIPAAQDLSNGGMNCVETGAAFQDITGTESPNGASAWQTSQTAAVTKSQGFVSGYPNLKWSLTGDNFTRTSTALWGTTRGPASTWAVPPFQYAMQSWSGFGNVLWVAMEDEVNSSWSAQPLSGPITFTASANQSWLSGGSIVASGGTCTVNGTGTNGWSLNGARQFIITGSVTPGMNSVAGTLYQATRVDNNHFTFSCASVANGTYNTANDSGLSIEPYVAQWFASNTDYIRYTAFQTLQTQYGAAAPGFSESWPNAGGTTCPSIANWGANGTQSLGSITQIAKHTDMYWNPGGLQFLISRQASNSLLTNNMGTWVRQNYGCFNPSLPITVLTQGTVVGTGNAGYGQQGYPVAITSISGGTVTFSAPHGILNVLPGITRLSIAGSSNSAYNANFYVIAAPTANTLTVVRTASDFTGTGTGGTVTFQNGDTKALTNISATGVNNCNGQGGGGCVDGDSLTYSGAFDANFARHRGQTFTVSGVTGTGASSFNSLVFLYTPQNLTSGGPTVYYREFPTGSSTGGTATINADNSYIKGRNWSAEFADINPGWSFGTLMECVILRCAGQRLYKWGTSVNGYWDSPSQGFVGSSQNLKGVFNDTTLSNPGQTFANQHFENGNVVPTFRAVSLLAMAITRWQKYILQPSLSSPDYGPLIDCAARSGSYGNAFFCFNATDGPEQRVFNLSAYETSGQQIVRNVVTYAGTMTVTILAAGTSTDTLTLNPDDAVFYVFPAAFGAEMRQPTIGVRLADVPAAAKVVVRYGYDPYFLDAPANTAYDCGTGTCALPVDRNIGPVYYRIVYLDSNSKVLATSDVGVL